jgi:hypothetical protein
MPLIDITTAFQTDKTTAEGENKEPDEKYTYTANEINRTNSFIRSLCNDGLQFSVESNGSASDIDDPIRMLSATIKTNLLQTTHTIITGTGTPDQNIYTIPSSTSNKKFLPRTGKINSINGYNLLIASTNTTSDVRISVPLVNSNPKKAYLFNGDVLPSAFLSANDIIQIFYDETLDGGKGGFKCTKLSLRSSTQTEANIGTNANTFITPATLAGSRPTAKITSSTNQVIGNGVISKILLPNTIFNDNSSFLISNSSITPLIPGKYCIGYGVQVGDGNTSGLVATAFLYKNSGSIVENTVVNSGVSTKFGNLTIEEANGTTDTFSLYSILNGASATTIIGGTNNTYLWMFRI